MKVLDSIVNKNNEVWIKVEFERSTDVLSKELFTTNDVETFKKEAVKEFLANLYEKWAEVQ